MRYSPDLRKRVLDFVKNGGKKTQASRTFNVSRTAIYQWLAAEDPLTWKKPGPRGPRLIDYKALEKHVVDFPDKTLAERAEHFGVSKDGIWYALSKLRITRKKSFGYKEQCPVKRATYKTSLTEAREEGLSPVYIDETGFRSETVRCHGYAPRGVCVPDMRSGFQRYRHTSLIAARSAQGFTASALFTGSCNAERFNEWLQQTLCPQLTRKHVVIMDNARWHKTQRTRELIASSGARLLYRFPPYSPDLNPIEQDFANIKRHWEYNNHRPLEDIIKMYK